MTAEKHLTPDYLFEVSWEVCNKVGGIYTVISTKAPLLAEKMKDNYILIGPDVWKETRSNPEFIEDKYIYRLWHEKAMEQGLKFRIGHWNIPQKPLVILVDFTQLFAQKDIIFLKLWEKYQLDSYFAQWDYIEPALFGVAAARIIRSFYEFHCFSNDKIVAHFHEWMTGSGILYLKDKSPQIATIFTTHATILGRTIAGNHMPLYSKMKDYDATSLAKNFGIDSKFSLEKISANNADAFTTVGEITVQECRYFLNKTPDILTPNGFNNSFVPEKEIFQLKRAESRHLIKQTAEALTNSKISDDTVFILNSGRYEFHNKGIDVFIDALGKINREGNLSKNILAVIAVPAGHTGPVNELIQKKENNDFSQPVTGQYCTHYLSDVHSDPILNRIKENNLNNSADDKVKIMFIPCYLDGNDGVLNLTYYDFLTAFDLSVFPSYYEPWGYTPLESIAFGIPTITTTLAGFGLWVMKTIKDHQGFINVINRTDENQLELTEEIAKSIEHYTNCPENVRKELSEKAKSASLLALWPNMIIAYEESFNIALKKSLERYETYKNKTPLSLTIIKQQKIETPPWKKILIKPSVPEKFAALQALTRNLWWTWNNEAIELFSIIKPKLWEACNHNPIALLGSLTLDDYKTLENNHVFMQKLEHVSKKFCDYMAQASKKPETQVAYFSMEFGLHNSIKTYSGGLGILAGDFLKEASDSNVNIIGVSLLYRYGYFDQNISLLGDQIESYHPQKYSLLPLIPVRKSVNNGNDNGDDDWLKVKVAAPGRTIYAKVWRIDVGRVSLYLLDTDIEENNYEDRKISHKLYGGDNELRFRQELMLGIGGVRALTQMGFKPDVFHCNEGHAAFMGIERMQKLVQEENLSFYEALEVVKSSTIFTTHTPIPAGHDIFSEDLLRTYIPHYADRLKISWETFVGLGRKNVNDPSESFNMSVLASRLSSEINGVSKIHGKVSANLLAPVYPGFFPEEIDIGYVTNGVHFPTWVSKRWRNLYDKTFDKDYINNQSEPEFWKKIYEVPDKTLWDIRQKHRTELIQYIKNRVVEEMTHRQDNPKNIFKVSETLNENVLTIGFARRFVTYKRALLLFHDPERLASIINNSERPIQFIYAGKAHPNDKAGQEFIKQIYEISQKPEFLGKVVFVENYDINLAKHLVQGVDIWLNTPTRPEEASGTSGMKAVMNGVLNFSVLDGWWAEGYLPNAGWALKEERTYDNQQAQNALDAVTIYNMLENEIAPLFYERNKEGIPEKWMQYIKNTIACIAPRFTMKRMLDEYYEKFYNTLFERSKLMSSEHFANARRLASWKQKVLRCWEDIEVLSVNTTDPNKKPLSLGETFTAEITLRINELNDEDLGVELLFGQKVNDVVERIKWRYDLQIKNSDGNIVTYFIELPMEVVGVFDYVFRVYPKNPLLAHRRDFGLMKWV